MGRQEALRRDQAEGAGQMSAFVVWCFGVLFDVSQNHQGGEQRLVGAHKHFVREQRDQELDAGAHVLLAQRAVGHQRPGRVGEAGKQQDGIGNGQARNGQGEMLGGRCYVQPRAGVFDVEAEEARLERELQDLVRDPLAVRHVGEVVSGGILWYIPQYVRAEPEVDPHAPQTIPEDVVCRLAVFDGGTAGRGRRPGTGDGAGEGPRIMAEPDFVVPETFALGLGAVPAHGAGLVALDMSLATRPATEAAPWPLWHGPFLLQVGLVSRRRGRVWFAQDLEVPDPREFNRGQAVRELDGRRESS